MTPPGIHSAISQLQQILDDLYQISNRGDAERKLDLVQLRRQLSHQMQAIGDAVQTCPIFLRSPDLVREFREQFSLTRSAIALHQATWPAVSVDAGLDGYRQSAAKVRATNLQFLRWLEAVLSDKAPEEVCPNLQKP